MIIESKSMEETHMIAGNLLEHVKPGTVIALIGDLGAGKTVFSQGFAKALGIKERVGSPTFKLVSEYYGEFFTLYHIDAYRLKGSSDFLNIGGEEYLYSENSFTLIEWANIIEDILPKNIVTIKFSRIKKDLNIRVLEVKGLYNES